MPSSIKFSENLNRFIAEHASVLEFVKNLDETIAIWNVSDVAEKINRIRSFLKTHVVEHFKFEDQDIFPELQAGCRDAATSCRVAALQDDHKTIMQDIAKLNELLTQAENASDDQVMAQLDAGFRTIVGRLQQHAAKEDTLFPSLTVQD